MPLELITTDRILQRWAVSVGAGLPTEEWDDAPQARPDPLPDDIAITVDQCILKAPPRTQEVITRWYKTPEPVEVIGRALGMIPRNVYRARAICLEFMRWRFIESGDKSLIVLVDKL